MDMLGGLVLQLRNVTAKIPTLPRLNWEERSDWINVKTKVTPKAVGDGVADDTAALQAALDSLKSEGYANPNTIYLPPGVYRITRTLSWEKALRQTHRRPRAGYANCLGRRRHITPGDVPQQRRHRRRAV